MKRFALMVALAASIVVALSSTSLADAPNASSTAKASAYVGPSVVHVETTYKATVFNANVPAYVPDEAGRPKVFTVTVGCTGFIVNSAGYVATAGHCVDPKAINRRFVEAAVAWYIRLGADGTPVWVLQQADFVIRTANPDSERRNADRGAIRVAWGSADSQQKKARLINVQSAAQGDAALLRIGGTDLRAVELATSRDLEIGTGVVSAGYANAVDDDFQPSYEAGEIRSSKTVGDGSVFEVSAALTPGMSGGPATTTDGDVIGFNSYLAGQGDGESDQFQFIGSSDRIMASLSAAGVTNELGPTSRKYAAGLDAYFAGDKERAVELLQAVVDAQPTHPTAQLYADRAKELSEDNSSSFPIALVLGLAVTVVAVGGAAALLMRLVRRERPDVRDEVVARRLESLIDPPTPDRRASSSSDVGEHEHMERR